MLSAVLLLGLAAACKSDPSLRTNAWSGGADPGSACSSIGVCMRSRRHLEGQIDSRHRRMDHVQRQDTVKEYRKLAEQFNPQKFDAKAWVGQAKAAGMKYITITSKHHDGFALYGSKASSYNIVDATPFKRDPIKELAEECRRQGLKMCFYYSQVQDWNEPGGYGNTWDFPVQGDFQKYLDEKVKPQLTELLTQYGPVGMIWFDTPYNISQSRRNRSRTCAPIAAGLHYQRPARRRRQDRLYLHRR
jgi:hypothetical protein